MCIFSGWRWTTSPSSSNNLCASGYIWVINPTHASPYRHPQLHLPRPAYLKLANINHLWSTRWPNFSYAICSLMDVQAHWVVIVTLLTEDGVWPFHSIHLTTRVLWVQRYMHLNLHWWCSVSIMRSSSAAIYPMVLHMINLGKIHAWIKTII